MNDAKNEQMTREVKNKKIQRGDIFIVDLGHNEGSIQSGVRPCIIIINDDYISDSNYLHCIPLTKAENKKGKKKLPTWVLIKNKCLKFDSIAMAEQENLIEYKQIKNKLGSVSSLDMEDINKAIANQRGIEYWSIRDSIRIIKGNIEIFRKVQDLDECLSLRNQILSVLQSNELELKKKCDKYNLIYEIKDEKVLIYQKTDNGNILFE